MKSPKNPNHSQQQIREAAKFKLIGDQLHLFAKTIGQTQFQMRRHQVHSFGEPIGGGSGVKMGSKWWRIYLDEKLLQLGREKLESIILLSFQYMLKLRVGEEHQSTAPFVNVNNLLIEQVAQNLETYYPSHLDINCIIVHQTAGNGERGGKPYVLQCYEFREKRQIKILKDFIQQIDIRIGLDCQPFFLVFKNKTFYVTRNAAKNESFSELTHNQLLKSQINVPQNKVVIKLPLQLISSQEQQQGADSDFQEVVEMHIPNTDTFQLILSRINRIKYCKYHTEEPLVFKERYSFDFRFREEARNDGQLSSEKGKVLQRPQVPKSILHQISGISTNVAQESKSSDYKKSKMVFGQTKGLKISQRVMPSPKDSNLVSSEIEYPVSVRGEQNEKEVPYFDQFQNLLGEEEGQEENKLTLNDSFQEFEKKERSEKNMNILFEVNKRKDRESKDKQEMEELKDRIKKLIDSQREWISLNLKLKVEIKRLKSNENKNQLTEIEEMKAKIMELKHTESSLKQNLEEVKDKNILQTLPITTNQLNDSPYKQEISKYTALKPMNGPSANFNLINMSVRSNREGDSKMQIIGGPQQTSKKVNTSTPLVTNVAPKQVYKPYYQPMEQGEPSFTNIYSSVPSARKYMMPNFVPPSYCQTQPQVQGHSANVAINQVGGNACVQNNGGGESGNYVGPGANLSSPRINIKKNALQYFMTSATKI